MSSVFLSLWAFENPQRSIRAGFPWRHRRGYGENQHVKVRKLTILMTQIIIFVAVV